MKTIQSISIFEDVTLISLPDFPADITKISNLFNMISDAGINVDMISQIPPKGSLYSLSFTVSDEDFGKVLEISTKLREINPDLMFVVSSGNCKISVYGDEMKKKPGVASMVFEAAAEVNADIRMITTSETDISLLVTKADLENTVNAITKRFR